MAQIAPGALHNFLTGETVDANSSPTGANLNPVFETIRVAHNDTDTKLGLVYTKTNLDAGQLDNRYYTKALLDGGQLNTIYYTKAQLDTGQLNAQYYTKTELLNGGLIDTRYYTKSLLDAGQLNNLYYTKSLLDTGQLDNRYYTQLQVDTKLQTIQAGAIVDGSVTNLKLATDVKIGSLAALTTTAKASVTAAINEVNAGVQAVGSIDTLTTTNKSNTVNAINEVNGKVGLSLAALTTTDKSSTIAAINEVNAKVPTAQSITKATANDVQITSTAAQAIATFIPPAKGNFLVGITFRVVAGTTTVTIVITSTDASGAQTDTIVNAQVTAIGTYRLIPSFINATAAAITVTVTASVANQVFASASIMGV